MKKIGYILMVVLIGSLVACGGTKASEKYLSEGKALMENGEYDEANKMFKLALVDDENNVEAKELIEVSEGFGKLKDMKLNNDFTQYESILEKIKNLDALEAYKDELNKNIEEIDKIKKETEKVQKEKEAVKKELGDIDKLFDVGEIDKIKERVGNLLEKVETEEVKKDINKRLERADKVIEDGKNKIKNSSTAKELTYKGVVNINGTAYDKVEKLKGKKALKFVEAGKEYIYIVKNEEIYEARNGDIYFVNTGKKVFDKAKYEEELEIKKIEEQKKANAEIFNGLVYAEKNKNGAQTMERDLKFYGSEYDIMIEYSTWDLQYGNNEDGSTVSPSDVTKEMFDRGDILARGNQTLGRIMYQGESRWKGDLKDGTFCEIKKIGAGKFKVTIGKESKTYTAK